MRIYRQNSYASRGKQGTGHREPVNKIRKKKILVESKDFELLVPVAVPPLQHFIPDAVTRHFFVDNVAQKVNNHILFHKVTLVAINTGRAASFSATPRWEGRAFIPFS